MERIAVPILLAAAIIGILIMNEAAMKGVHNGYLGNGLWEIPTFLVFHIAMFVAIGSSVILAIFGWRR